MRWKKEDRGWGVDLEEARYMFVKHSDFTEERTWLWWWSVGDVVDSVASGYARTKAEAQRCAVAVATAMGWVNDEPKGKVKA